MSDQNIRGEGRALLRSVFLKGMIVLGICLGVHFCVLAYFGRHYYWGNRMLTDKLYDWKNNYAAVNTLFIGSSKTHRGVVAALFDSLASSDQRPVRSYNLGVSSMFSVESYYVLEHLLKTDAPKLDYVFVELNGAQIGPGLMRLPRGKYFLNLENYTFAMRAMLGSHFTKKGKWLNCKQYTINFLERLTMYGLWREYFENVVQFDPARQPLMPYHQAGFFSFEMELQHAADQRQIRLGKRHMKMLKDTSMILKKLAWQPPVLKEQANAVHLKKIKALIKLAENRGVRLIFYHMPSQKKYNNHVEVSTLLHNLDESNKIDLSDGRKYPALFYTENLYNPEHLNERGARLFTAYLAEAFNRLNL